MDTDVYELRNSTEIPPRISIYTVLNFLFSFCHLLFLEFLSSSSCPKWRIPLSAILPLNHNYLRQHPLYKHLLRSHERLRETELRDVICHPLSMFPLQGYTKGTHSRPSDRRR